MKSWFKYLGLGLLAYITFLVLSFPANQAYFLVEDALDENNIPLELYEVKGTVWSGKSGRLVYDKKPFDNFSWEFLPLDILKGKVSVLVSFKNKESFANLIASRSFFGEVSLSNVRANMSAQEVLSLAKIPAVKLGGDFTLNLAQLVLGDNKLESIIGRLVWSSAESMFPQKLVMGDIFANMTTADDGTVNVRLGDGGGPLELNGDLSLNPDGNYNLFTEMSSREGRQSNLGRSLGFIARYNPQGKAEFKRSGSVSEFDFLLK